MTRIAASMNLESFYIEISLIVISAVLSLAFFVAWKYFGRSAHALTWAMAFLAGTLQWLCVVNSYAFPSKEAYLLAQTGFSIVLITLWVRGHCQRTKCGWLPDSLWRYAVAVYAIIAWYILVDPNVGMRKTIVPAYAALTLVLSVIMIIRHRPKTRPAEWAAATAIGLFALIQVGAAVLAFMQGPGGDESVRAIYRHFNFLTIPAGYVATAVLIILMMASDLSARMKEMAIRDELTGLLNRRGFREYGERAYSATRRAGLPMSMIMSDIDRFKSINDKFGHAAGDMALVHFANLVSATRRNEDVIARVGGEEFALLLPGTDLRDAMAIADQLCDRIGETPLEITSTKLPMTASFGVATIRENDTSLDDVVLRADRALYRSKRAGRNQVDLESSQLMRAADGTLVPVSP